MIRRFLSPVITPVLSAGLLVLCLLTTQTVYAHQNNGHEDRQAKRQQQTKQDEQETWADFMKEVHRQDEEKKGNSGNKDRKNTGASQL